MIRALALLLLFALVLPASGQISKFDAGLALYRDGRLREAIGQFSASREIGESAPLLDFYQGVCLAKLGDWGAASQLLLAYVSVQPADAHGWYWLSRVQLFQKQFTKARNSVQRSLDLDPESSESYRTLGEVELELNNHDAAYRAWIVANKWNPGDAQTTYYLGRLFFEAEFFNEASVWLRDTLQLAPTHYAAMTYLGLCTERLGDGTAAAALYKRAIRESKLQNAPYPWAYLSYAKLLRQTGNDAGALSFLEESERLCPDPHALSILGQLLVAEHQNVRAEAVLRRAIAMNSEISELHYRLSVLLRAKGVVDEAKSEMARFGEAKKLEERTQNRISAIRLVSP